MATKNPDRPVRLLHLSDIHFRAGNTWDSDPVLRHLVQFIAGEVKRGLEPDLVHIAGRDSAWMACGGQDRGRLLLGRWQLNQAVDTQH